MDDCVESKHEADETAHAPEAPPPTGMRSASLMATLANHIVPRLLLAHRMEARAVEHVANVRPPPTREEVSSLVELAVAQDVVSAMAHAEAKLQEGLSFESLLLDWISEAGRSLGQEWQRDERSFTDVTLGLGALHRLLAMLRSRFRPPLSHRGLVLLLAAPGEQHTLAVHVLGDLLRLAGWDAAVEPNLAEEELLAVVATDSVAVLGISVSCSSLLEPLERLIARARERSLNRDLVVMLGGALDLSGQAEKMGAIFCPTARMALSWLEHRSGTTS